MAIFLKVSDVELSEDYFKVKIFRKSNPQFYDHYGQKMRFWNSVQITLAGKAKLKCDQTCVNSTPVKLWPTDDDSVLNQRSQTGFYSLSNEIKKS